MVDLLQQHRSGTSGFSESAGPGWPHSRITTRKSRVAFINLSSTCQHGRHTRAQPGEPLWQHTAITLSTWLWYPGPQLPSTSGGELEAAPLQLSAQLSQKTLTFRAFFLIERGQISSDQNLVKAMPCPATLGSQYVSLYDKLLWSVQYLVIYVTGW